MPVKLPDFTALGFDEPTATNVRPSYYSEDPEAAGQARIGASLEKLGTGVEQAGTAASLLGGQIQHNTNLANGALAQAYFHNEAATTLSQIQRENDPAKVDQLTAQLRGHLDAASQLIPDSGFRNVWLDRHSPELTNFQIAANKRQNQIYDDRYMAGRDGQIQTTLQRGIQSDDPAVQEQAKKDIGTIFASSAQAGVTSQSQAVADARKANEQMLVGRVHYLDSQGRPSEALDYAKANLSSFTDPAVADALINSLTSRAKKQNVTGIANAFWGGADKGYAGNRGQAGLEGDFAKRSGVFGTPEEAGRQLTTVTAPGGASFQVHDMAAPQISGFLNDLAATGYKIDPANSGGYNNRNKVGVNTDEKSEHAYGTAIDINTDKNKQSDQLVTDLPPNVAQLATKWGLKWGGTFSGKKDAMHFEVARLLPGGQPSPDTTVLPANMAKPGPATADDPRGMGPVIRSAAQANGVDPNVAMRVARAEGLTDRLGDGGTSGGAFQLHVGGGGLGDEFQQETGLDPLDPKNEPATIYWAMQNLGRTGWAPYRGAAATGVGPTQGITGGGAPAPAQLAQAGGALPSSIAGTGGAQAFAPLPDIRAKQQAVQDAVDNGQLDQETGNAVMAQLQSRYNHLQGAQAADKAALERAHLNTVAALSDGRDIDYNPAAYYHFFPAEQAAEKLQQLQDAQEAGQITSNIRTGSPADNAQRRQQLASGLDQPGAPDYAKRRELLRIFDTNLKTHEQALVGPQADPVPYLLQYNKLVRDARAAVDPQNPTPESLANFANILLSEQTRLGLAPNQQHLLGKDYAQQKSLEIGQDPEHAPDQFRSLAGQWGQYWPKVWSDLITIGKMPAEYQVVGQLADYDQANAAVLARAMGARTKDNPAFEKLISTKMPGGQSIKDVANEKVPNDPKVQAYERSLLDSGSSPGQTIAIRSAIEHLAAGRSIFLQESPSTAAEKAIDAVVGHYEFMPNGGARVPVTRFDDVSANARETIDGLSVDHVAVPARFAGTSADLTRPGAATEPKPQEYIDQLKANPIWITGPKADRLLLLDPGGRVVNDSTGVPISVPFSMPRMVPLAPVPPSGTPTFPVQY